MCESGLISTLGKCVYIKMYRGFESHHLRQKLFKITIKKIWSFFHFKNFENLMKIDGISLFKIGNLISLEIINM